ncbi:hypothetical protein [Clostridium sp. E02]|uniref:hypothetical protein n=1 Tax=Clostridium sp. E02 TaxID=2487134 RepID=UPI000F535730|nr:hypothetical protein [Clostridium sp. E02]
MTPYEDKKFKDTLLEEKKKLKDMTFKNKMWYIWEYYKIPIIGVIVTVSLAVSIGSAVLNNRHETALSCVILNSQSDSQQDLVGEYFDPGFRQYIELPEEVEIDVDHTMSLSFDESEMNEFTYAEMAKLSAMITSKELDVMIAKEDSIDHFGQMGGFYDFKELLPPDVYDKVKDNLYLVTNQETGETAAYGLKLTDTDFLKKTGLRMKEPILSVLINSTHTDTALQLIRYVYGL